MKVTLDLTELVARGELTTEEAEKLARLGAADTGSLGSNILLGFGTVAVALGGGFLFPTAQSVDRHGRGVFALGLGLSLNRQRWAAVRAVLRDHRGARDRRRLGWLSDGSTSM